MDKNPGGIIYGKSIGLDEIKTPTTKPYDETEYKFKQSKYSTVGKLPCRTILLATGNSGKTLLLSNFILDIYKDCFEMIYIWSPSIDIDPAWSKVKEYIDKQIKSCQGQSIFQSL